MKKYYLISIASIIASSLSSLYAQEDAQTSAKGDIVESTEVSAKNAEAESVFFVGVEDLAEKADAGDIDAQITLAGYFLNGTIVEKNEIVAAKYFAKAGDLGSLEAAYNAGVLYQKLGNSVENGKALAFKYFKIAANDNLAAMYNLGACYVNGIGTRQDLVKAYYCFSKASAEFKEAEKILRQLESALGDDNIKKAKDFLAKTDKI